MHPRVPADGPSAQLNSGERPELARSRPHFDELTPFYPQERLRLEDGNPSDTASIIDLVAPIGKGQRGLIVSPPKAGKTMVLQAIAASIAASHPEVQLMVVLVGERPEEVTDLSRSIRGEVVYSTFDQAPEDHIRVAELAIERTKRLVEAGGDMVVLLDSITRLGRPPAGRRRRRVMLVPGAVPRAARLPSPVARTGPAAAPAAA